VFLTAFFYISTLSKTQYIIDTYPRGGTPDSGAVQKGHFFFLDSPKWEKTAREDAFLMPKALEILQKRAASGKSKGAVQKVGQPLLIYIDLLLFAYRRKAGHLLVGEGVWAGRNEYLGDLYEDEGDSLGFGWRSVIRFSQAWNPL
jgi:hypothetical protein